MKKFFALLLALVMSLSLVACGGGDTANEDTSTDDTATEENGGDTATASDVEIAVVLKTLASEYWGYVKAGCDAAAADLGVTVNVVGPGAESEIEQQVSMIEQQIGAGCDAIIVAPNDAGAASGALASAIGSIPVLSVDTNVGIEGQTSFVGTSNVDAAKEGGLWPLNRPVRAPTPSSSMARRATTPPICAARAIRPPATRPASPFWTLCPARTPPTAPPRPWRTC